MKRADLLKCITDLMAAETAPYEEIETSIALHQWLTKLKLPFETDEFGNTLVRVRRGMPRRQVGLVAHLDHPGIRVTAVKKDLILCSAEGGLPTQGLIGTKVIFPRSANGRIKGVIDSVKINSQTARPRVESLTVQVKGKSEFPLKGDFGIFDLPASRASGNRLRARACDDLVGCVAAVAALSEIHRGTDPVDVWGLFTRAEEVGFVGSMGLGLSGHVPRDMFLVSVECSRAMGDVSLGKGPVIRLGDAYGPLDPRVTAFLTGAAKSLDKKIQYQRALMPGGTCEATAFLVLGYQAGGIAIPLESYHNQSEKGVVPEEVDLRDVEGAIKILVAAAFRAGEGIDDVSFMRNELVMNSEEGREKLKDTCIQRRVTHH